MIVITGAGGFIGSHMIKLLNDHRFFNLIAVDQFDEPHKLENIKDKNCVKVERNDLEDWLDQNYEEVEFIFHLGARTDTLETDIQLLNRLNTEYTKMLWAKCVDYQIPLIYASSAATYGQGELGFDDDHMLLPSLKPLNAYAHSKHSFDLWAIGQTKKPFFWMGLKFFNVYGQNEAHKGRMASMVYQLDQQIKQERKVRLFKSTDKGILDGDQTRDFIPVESVCAVLYWLMNTRKHSGIFNLGSGKATSFNQVAAQLFNEANQDINIEYFEMPDSLKSSYQNHTQAALKKISSTGVPMELIYNEF